ncbi:methyltransferase domain-containing protein [Candidatus Woesearchaeota archaeon]|nr:methyltransferase domain-containing protein [Candidatus Woesearchaeota archaeon]
MAGSKVSKNVIPKNVVLIKKARVLDDNGRKRKLSGVEKFYVDPSKDFHSHFGVIRKEELSKKPGSVLKCGSEEFVLLGADFIDDYKRIKRSAQIIGLKDIGPIITQTGLNRNSVVLEAGVGSGALTCYLASVVKKVVSFDVDSRSLETARENVKRFGYRNVSISEGSIYDPKTVKQKGFDVLMLDVPEPWKAIETASKALKTGGFIVVYVPNVSQVQEFVKALGIGKFEGLFLVEKTIEVVEREWAVDENRTRPVTKDHAHTGFLTFVRKLF